jgi:hypothetical protein
MSTIYERPDGSIVMYTKGADGVIYDRLDQAASSEIKVIKFRLQTRSFDFGFCGMHPALPLELPGKSF